MDIILDEYEIHVNILERSGSISQHTGRELEHIKVNATIEGVDINENVINYLATAKEGGINSKEGQITKNWKLTNNSYRYTNDKELVDYSLELEEIEEIILDNLILDGLEFTPYQYKEDFDYDECLSADVRVLLSETQFKKIKELIERDSFTVIRHGINETPRQMHLAIEGWSRDDKSIKYQFKLSDLKENKELGGVFGALGRLIPLVIKQDQMIEQLSNILIQKNILERGEYLSIKARIPKRNLEKELELYQVSDLDEWDF